MEPAPADVANPLSRFVPVYPCSLPRWWPRVEIGAILRGVLVVAENWLSADRLTASCAIPDETHIGLIELNAGLDVETVSEIFVRINSQGVSLNAADFAMSKIAANETYNGHQLRKCIDYFCHLAIAPEAYADLARDTEFAGTRYFRAMEWLKHEKEDLYDPSYTDMLRA